MTSRDPHSALPQPLLPLRDGAFLFISNWAYPCVPQPGIA